MNFSFTNILYKILEKISSIFKYNETSKNWSSVRIAFIYNDIFSTSILFVVWGVMSLKQNIVLDIPSGVVALYATAIGVGFAGKYAQSKLENKQPASDADVVDDTTNDSKNL